MAMGKLRVIELTKDKQETFLNYIYPGFCLKTVLAVDFSMTKAKKQDSAIVQEYGEALSTVGRLLNYYDDDEEAVSLGFGAKLPPYHNVVSHCFAMNMNYFSPTMTIPESEARYKENLSKVKLHGPVIISEVIKFGADLARYVQKRNPKYYIVLVVITEGNIADKDIAINEINNSSDLPFSILLVGIGDGDFSTLKQFDGDMEGLGIESKGIKLRKDIVQFIHYRKYREDTQKLA